MTVVVLGWDGLDPERVTRYGLDDAFGPTTTSIETITNESLEKPHTYEIWPSIITGCQPDEHGIYADAYIEGGWDSRLLSWAARASRVLPEAVRWRAGRLVRDAGAEYAFETPEYYRDHDIPTVFDGRRSVALGVPNYRTALDERLGISMDRGAALASYLDVETAGDGSTIHRPSVDPRELGMRLAGEAGEKLAAARASLATRPDVVFVWLGYLDTVGHVAPTLADADAWHRYHYRQAAAWTASMRGQLDGDDALVCISDHGLSDGEHTTPAYLGGTDTSLAGLEHVTDLYGWLDDHATTTTDGDAVAPWHGRDSAGDDVQEELEALGYI